MFRFVFALVVIAQSLIVYTAHAASASLLLSPLTASVVAGNTIDIAVQVTSVEKVMNTASGEIVFPADKLEVSSIVKRGSIINLWPVDPDTNTTAGNVKFGAVRFNPGFQGMNGQLFTIRFQTKTVGVAVVRFVSGSVLENDGNGTLMTTATSDATITVKPNIILPGGVVISSPTHPDQNRWYANNNPVLRWTMSGATTASYLLDRVSNTTPDTGSEGNRSSVTYSGVGEGIWYFHIRNGNVNGWRDAGHFRLQIDIEKPDYFTISQPSFDLNTARASFDFDAFDKTSGIDYLNFQVDDECSRPWRGPTKGVFQTAPLLSGKHILKATAFDRAGNFLFRTVEFEIAEGGRAPISTIVLRPRPASESTSTKSETIIAERLASAALILIIILLLLLWYAFSRVRALKKEIHNQ